MAQNWILRKGTKERGFRYVGADGKAVRDPATRARIDALRIPPAWTDVHIAATSRSAVQAWGLDARGRKQYRYHARAVERGELRKFYRVRQMAKDLPQIRRKLRRDYAGPGYTREKLCAAVVSLISRAWFRVGSDRYERENKTFGITTLRKSHVTVEGDVVRFRYVGKRGIEQKQLMQSADFARFIRFLLKSPGRRLFRYKRNGKWFDLTARDVNEYIRNLTGFPYVAKDFRTWGATVMAATTLDELGSGSSESARKKNMLTAVRAVARDLGNTPAIVRKSYVHPLVLQEYLKSGATIQAQQPKRGKRRRFTHLPEEEALIRFLDRHFPDRRRRPRAA